MPRRILVDLLGFTGSRGGTETYSREISSRLPQFLPGDELIAVTNRTAVGRIRDFFPGEVRSVQWVGSGRAAWAAGEILAVNHLARSARADVVWCPANFGPVRRRAAGRVVTAHDMIYQDVKGSAPSRLIATATAWLMTRAVRSADAVISGSRAAADAVHEHIGVPASEIVVIPHGTRDPEVPADPWGAVASLGIRPGRPVVLSTGNRLAHKNFEGLVRALAAIDPAHRPVAVITGGRDDDPLRPLVSQLHLDDDVVLPGWVSAEQLESLYAVADLYVCPSLIEGFGLPVIDAMRRGCVVLANDVPVLREVGGAAALYADATSATEFGAAIRMALTDAQGDEKRRTQGRSWSSQFTWDASARLTAEVLAATADRTEHRRA